MINITVLILLIINLAISIYQHDSEGVYLSLTAAIFCAKVIIYEREMYE